LCVSAIMLYDAFALNCGRSGHRTATHELANANAKCVFFLPFEENV
jgi:hypothetical protein